MTKKALSFLLLSLILAQILLAIPVLADTILTIQPSTSDTFLYEFFPDISWDGPPYVDVADETDHLRRTLLVFNISAIPEGSTINSANLSLYYYAFVSTNPTDKIVQVHELTQNDWVEDEATWNSYKTGSTWITAGGDYEVPSISECAVPASTHNWMTWNVTEIVNDSIASNLTTAQFLLKLEEEDLGSGYSTVAFYSRDDSNADTKPKLVIDYTPPPEIIPPVYRLLVILPYIFTGIGVVAAVTMFIGGTSLVGLIILAVTLIITIAGTGVINQILP